MASQHKRQAPKFTEYYTNLSDSSLGSRVIFATDEFFAVCDNLLNPHPPQFDPKAYCSQGKVMDGWESRRKRVAGHDWCIIRLAYCGTIAGLEIDTGYFTGNHAPKISISAAYVESYLEDPEDSTWCPGAHDRSERGGGIRGSKSPVELIEAVENACMKYKWIELLPVTKLNPGYEETRYHYFRTPGSLCELTFTHVRVNYYPDGGVARLRCYGDVNVDFEKDIFVPLVASKGEDFHETDVPVLDLASVGLGGRGIACSNKHFGIPRNLLKPGRGADMGDGWEVARHPDRPANIPSEPITDLKDWVILQLGTSTSQVERIVLDTCHFKGNFPESATVEGGCLIEALADREGALTSSDAEEEDFSALQISWFPLLPQSRLKADKIHSFELSKGEILQQEGKVVSHVRVTIYPDGGLSRVRIFARPMRHSLLTSHL